MESKKPISRPHLIAVIGHASHAKEIHLKTAYEVGKLIAESGAILLCGGNPEGVPNAAARGASESSGITVGITPKENSKSSSQHLTIPIHTGMGFARNQIIGLSADALIAIGGGVGTLTEMAYSYAYKKPIIVIEGLGGIPEQYIGKYLDEKKTTKILGSKTPEEAVKMALKNLKNI